MRRDIFDTSSYNAYMKTVENDLDRVINNERNKMIACISHDCNGENIKDCDPNVDMFVIKTEDV
jgi:hypothetical protein